jgi:glycosyltransferase involved in cell wall biosynthesis
MNKIKLVYSCFMNSSGYSQCAQSYILALHKTGKFDIKLNIFDGKPSRNIISDENYEIFMEMKNKKDDPERIMVYHCIPSMQRRVKRPKKSIGMAVFETFSPPEKWISVLNNNDAIVVPSKFNYRVFAHAKIQKPLYYIPHCIDMNIYNKDVVPLYKYDKYTFGFVGIWRERKGYKQLIEAYIKEFKEKDNVQLLIKTDKTKKAEEYIIKIKKDLGINKGFAPIILENKVFDEKEMPKFIKSINCLISPTAGEGFGLMGLQCMALGIPVIITDFSGCQDYANKETANLLKPTGFILHRNMDNIPQFRNKKWAFLEVNKVQEKMRYVLCNQKEVRKKVNTAYFYVRQRFNYDVIGGYFLKMIREIYG